MTQVHGCGHHSVVTIFELERIREFAEKQNADVLVSHVALLEKSISDVGIACGIADMSDEQEHLVNIKAGVKEKNWEKVKLETKGLEKSFVLKMAENFSEGNDPLSVLPSRLFESL